MKNKGFTIVEILVVIGIMGAVSLITLKMIESQQGALKYTEARLNELEMYRQVQLNLSMRSACKETFVTRAPVGGVVLSASGAEITAIYQAPPPIIPAGYSGKKILETGIEYDEIKLSQLKITSEDPSTFGSLGNATLEIHTERLFKGVPKNQKKKLGMNVLTSATGVIEDCYIDEDFLMKSLCESLDGTWNTSVAPPKCIKPKRMMEEMCLSLGGTWAIPTPPNPLAPTEKQCLHIVSYNPAQCNSVNGLIAASLDPLTGKLQCSKVVLEAFDLDGAGAISNAKNLGPYKFCAIARTRWNPQNANPGTYFECKVNQVGANWFLTAERRNTNDNIRCQATCY